MKMFNLTQRRADVAAVIVDVNLAFLNKSSYQKNIWLYWAENEIDTGNSSDPDDFLIDSIQEFCLGDTGDLFGSALRSCLIKAFVNCDFELYSGLDTEEYGYIHFSYLDDRWIVYRTNRGFRFKPADPTIDYKGTYSEVYKTSKAAWEAALSFDYQNDQLGFIQE